MTQITSTWLAFTSDPSIRTALEEVSIDTIHIMIHPGGIIQAIEYLQHHESTAHLIIDLSNCTNPEKDIHQLADACQDGTQLITLGKNDTIAWYKRLQALGVDDYLVTPVQTHQITTAINHLNMDTPASISKNNSMLAIMGARGGLGSTTLAVNYAWLIAKMFQFKTCLLDFDFYYGDINLHFNKAPNHGLSPPLLSLAQTIFDP